MTPNPAPELASAALKGAEAAVSAQKPAVDAATQAGRAVAEQATTLATGAGGPEGGLNAIASTPANEAWDAWNNRRTSASQIGEQPRQQTPSAQFEQPVPAVVPEPAPATPGTQVVSGFDQASRPAVTEIPNPQQSVPIAEAVSNGGAGKPPAENRPASALQPEGENSQPALSRMEMPDLTQEAIGILNSDSVGGRPPYSPETWARIAKENGIDVTADTTPDQIIAAFRAKPTYEVEFILGTDGLKARKVAEANTSPATTTEAAPATTNRVDTAFPAEKPAAQPEPAAEMSEEEKLVSVFERMSPMQRQRRVDSMQRQMGVLERRQDKMGNLTDMDRVQTEIDKVQEQIDLMGDVQERMADEVVDAKASKGTDSRRQTREDRREAQEKAMQDMEDELTFEKQVAGMNSEQRADALLSQEGQLELLKQRERGTGLTSEQKEAIKDLKSKAEAKIAAIKRHDEAKKGKEDEQKAKTETEAQRAEDKRMQEEAIKAKADNPTAEVVEDFESNIAVLRNDISTAQGRMEDFTRWIDEAKAAGDEQSVNDLINQRRELFNSLKDSRDRLATYQSGLRAAKEVLRQQAGPEIAMGAENIKNMSNAEYQNATLEAKQARLQELANALPELDQLAYDIIQDKIYNGENLSQNELGQFVANAKDVLMSGNKKDIKQMTQDIFQLNGRYPEAAYAIVASIKATEAGNKMLEELLGEKLDKVKGNGGILALLLAIIGALAAGVYQGVAAITKK